MHLLKCYSRKQMCGVDTVHENYKKNKKSTYIVNKYNLKLI